MSTARWSGEVARRVRALHESMVERRRDLHRHPELGFAETRTAGIVAEVMRSLGAEVRVGVAKTGVVARIRGSRPGKTIALRADMDALPIVDHKDPKKVDYVSQVEGRMHACGHDGHVAMALGAAEVLASLRDELAGDVVFLFQPAEEGPGGAQPMIDEGALDGVDFVVGQHMAPSHDAGVVLVTEGPAMAASDTFHLHITGTGGHGAYPHLGIDPVPVAAQIVLALQTLVSRRTDPLAPAVVTVGTMRGGYRWNVIADEVELTGTVRTLDPALRAAMPGRIEALARGIAEAHGAKAEMRYDLGYPAVVNGSEGVARFVDFAGQALGGENVKRMAPSMGGEDFAYYLERRPGVFYWVGCRHPSPARPGYSLHEPTFDLDENALDVGARVYCQAALTYLGSAT
jgi:amidohydrolase